MVVDADNRPAAKSGKPKVSTPDAQDELAALRAQVVTLTREVSVLRWQFGKLLEQQPALSAGMTRVRSMIQRKFPRAAEKVAHFKRRLKSPAGARSQDSAAVNAAQQLVNLGALSLKTPILIAAEGAAADRIAAVASPENVLRVTPGAGAVNNLPVPPNSVATLQAAAPNSLAAFLAADPAAMRNLTTLVVDQGDDVSLALLRGHIVEGQLLLLVRGNEKSEITNGLGKPDKEAGGYALYSRFSSEWLDPLDKNGSPRAELIAGRNWPKISVVMVSFNQAVFLEEGLQSILDQGYPNLEFIVIDGNSTDGSVDILERYRSRLSTLVIERDKGQADGLNKGFARATGDIMTWVNSDDLLEPGALFRVAQAFLAHGVDMVAGGCRQIGLARSQLIHNHHTRLPYAVPVPLPLGLLLEMDRFWLNACFFYQPEVFFSRGLWMRSGGRLRTDLNYVLDYDLWVRMAAAGATIVHIPDFLACSRTHDQQKTTVGMPYLPEVQRLLREYAGKLVFPPDAGNATQ